MEHSNATDKSQSFKDNVPDHGKIKDSMPLRPPQKRKPTKMSLKRK